MRRTFFTGLVIALPLIITFWVVYWVVAQIHGVVNPIVVNVVAWLGVKQSFANAWIVYFAPIFSVFLGLVFIYGVGLIGGNVLGRQLLKLLERALLHVPVVGSIYSATRQFMDTFSKSSGAGFRRVVWLEYPRQGAWTLGFITNDVRPDLAPRSGTRMVSVFVPTTPNPTSGWLAIVPESETIAVPLTVDDAFKLIVSGGVISPPLGPKSSAPTSRA